MFVSGVMFEPMAISASDVTAESRMTVAGARYGHRDAAREAKRAWLVHRDVRYLDSGIEKTGFRDTLRKAFNQKEGRILDEGEHGELYRFVVDRVLDSVAFTCRMQVCFEHNVEDDILFVQALIRVDANDAATCEVADRDPII